MNSLQKRNKKKEVSIEIGEVLNSKIGIYKNKRTRQMKRSYMRNIL